MMLQALTDYISIEGLSCQTVIGVHNWERKIKQTLVVDLKLGIQCHKAAAKDEIVDTLDYFAVSKLVLKVVTQSRVRLIETLAEQIAERILLEFSVPWLWLKLSKPGAVPAAHNTAVIIERTFEKGGLSGGKH